MPDQTSPSPNLARAGMIMMISLFLSRVLGIVRDMVMAWRFGQDDMTDAYRLAFQVPDLLFFLIAGGALSSAFIPVFSEYYHTDRKDEAWKVFSSVTTLMAMFISALIVVAWIFAEPLTHLVAPGSPEAIRPAIAQMSQILLPSQLAFFLGGLMFGTLYARQVFSIPGLAPNVYNVAIIFGALVLSQFVQPGVAGMAWGALIGAFLGNMLIPWLAMRRLESKFSVSFDLKHPGVQKVFKLMLPVVLGLSLPGVYALIMQWFGTFYSEPGRQTALDLANRVTQAPLGVLGQSLAIAAFPTLSQFYAQGKMDLFGDQLSKSLRTILFLSIPVTALIILMPVPLLRAAFEHGSFTAQDTLRTALCVQTFAIGIVAWCAHPLLMRGFFALQSSLTPILLGTGASALFLALSAGIFKLGGNYPLLPVGGSLAAIALVIAMSLMLKKKVNSFDLVSVIGTFFKSLLAALICSAIFYGLLQVSPWLFGSQGRVIQIVTTAIYCLLFAWLYYGIARALKLSEVEVMQRALSKLDRRKKPKENP